MPDAAAIAARIKTFFETEFPRPDAVLTETTDLLEGWLMDSVGIVNTTMFLESEFGIAVRRADINAVHFKNIQSLTAYVLARTDGAGRA
jgi:acyl carrier protein